MAAAALKTLSLGDVSANLRLILMKSSIYFDLRGILPFPKTRLKYTGITRATVEWAKRLALDENVGFIAPGLAEVGGLLLAQEPDCGRIAQRLAKDNTRLARFTNRIATRLPAALEKRNFLSKLRRAVALRFEQKAFNLNTSSFLNAQRCDRFIYFTPFLHELPKRLPPACLPVINIFDIIPLLFADPMFGNTAGMRASIQQVVDAGAYFIVNSSDCRHSLIAMFDIPIERVFLVPLGVTSSPVDATNDLPANSRPYFLYVSSDVQRRKNIEGTIRAFSCYLEKSGADHELLIVGGGTEQLDGMIRAEAPFLPERIRGLGRVEEARLRQLYQGANCGLFLSLHEGFGLPVLEYMRFGTPVICSNVTSMPEVAGECALLVDPLSQEEIVGAMMTIAGDPALRQQLSAQGKLRAAEFTWERSAKTLQVAFDEILARAESLPSRSTQAGKAGR